MPKLRVCRSSIGVIAALLMTAASTTAGTMSALLITVLPAHATAAQSQAMPPATGPAAALNAAASEDIRDIRGPKFFVPFWVVPAVLAGIALLALGLYALWRWHRRGLAKRPPLPFEIALQRLEQLRALMQPSSVREFSIAITDTIRQYIEQRFQLTAAHRTTEEFLRDLLVTSQESLAAHRSLLGEFLHQCDLAKFAGMSLSHANMEMLYESAHTFVVATAKPPLPAEEPRATFSTA